MMIDIKASELELQIRLNKLLIEELLLHNGNLQKMLSLYRKEKKNEPEIVFRGGKEL